MKGDIHMSYKNILADKFMKDTNYIIIKDTDDLEDLEKQWELFKSCLTNRQQRLSDDRSIELWDMTNQQHYEAQKAELMKSLSSKLDDSNDEEQTIVYEPDEEDIKETNLETFTNSEEYIKKNSIFEKTEIKRKDKILYDIKMNLIY